MKLCFAPMDWITNAATRFITENIFQKYWEENDSFRTWTEFMNADGFVINPAWVIKHLITIENNWANKPILQLFWGRKEYLLKAVEIILDTYKDLFSGIELNTWCPSNTVMKSWWGSDMLKHRHETLDIIQSLSEKIHQSSDFSFSVKSRAWLTDEDKPEQLIFLREVSHFVDFITVHWRTLKQLYAWDADFSFIKELKQSVSIPVIANGWIENYEQACNVLSQGFDGAMIWQAAIGNPWVFTNYVPSLDEKKELMIEHLCLMIACEEYFKDAVEKIDWYSIKQPLLSDLNIYKDKIDEEYPYHSLVEFRKYAFQYIKGLGNVKEKKRMLLEVKTVKSFKEILNQLGDL